MSTPTLPLAMFLASHCKPLPDTTLLDVDRPAQVPPSSPLICPICLTPLLTAELPALQIILSSCKHVFCADCLSRYILAGYNTCPLCRSQWYEIPEGATTGQTAALSADERIAELERLVMLLFDDVAATREEVNDGAESPGSGTTAVDSDGRRSGEQPPDGDGEDRDGASASALLTLEDVIEWRRQQQQRREEGRFFNWTDMLEGRDYGI